MSSWPLCDSASSWLGQENLSSFRNSCSLMPSFHSCWNNLFGCRKVHLKAIPICLPVESYPCPLPAVLQVLWELWVGPPEDTETCGAGGSGEERLGHGAGDVTRGFWGRPRGLGWGGGLFLIPEDKGEGGWACTGGGQEPCAAVANFPLKGEEGLL